MFMQRAWLWGVEQIIKIQVVKAGLDQNWNLEKINTLNIIKYGTFGRTILGKKIGERKRKPNDANVANEGEIHVDVESVLVVSIGSSSDGWILNLACTFHIFPNRN